ncbi:MAG: ABC transporter permease subunit [Candidatus Lokiarchaeota archaeon]|nr:ABC transporter permease subunit [Candidatus Lokiarchaeota archaeon]
MKSQQDTTSVSQSVPQKGKDIRKRRGINLFLKIILPITILVGLWQLVAILSGTSIVEVVEAFVRLSIEGDSEGHLLIDHVRMSLFRVVLGFLTAIITAIPIGIAIGRYQLINDIFGPVVDAMRPIPPIAWIPLSILMFRANLIGSQVFIIWIGAFFPILINTTTGVRRTEPVHVDVAKTFGASETQILSKIVIPSAGPEIFAGFRIGFGIGWMCLVASEMIGGGLGLGYLVLIMQQVGRTGEVISAMLLIGLIGFLISYVFLIIEKNLLKWRQDVSV